MNGTFNINHFELRLSIPAVRFMNVTVFDAHIETVTFLPSAYCRSVALCHCPVPRMSKSEFESRTMARSGLDSSPANLNTRRRRPFYIGARKLIISIFILA